MWPGVHLVITDRAIQQHRINPASRGGSRSRSLPTTAPGKLRPYHLAILLTVAAIERRCVDDRAFARSPGKGSSLILRSTVRLCLCLIVSHSRREKPLPGKLLLTVQTIPCYGRTKGLSRVHFGGKEERETS